MGQGKTEIGKVDLYKGCQWTYFEYVWVST